MSQLGTMTVTCMHGHETVYKDVETSHSIPKCPFKEPGQKKECACEWGGVAWKANPPPPQPKRKTAWD